MTLLFIDKDVLRASVVASGTSQRRVHLLGNDAMLMTQESLVSRLCTQRCKSLRENCAINGLLQEDQAQEHPVAHPAGRCLQQISMLSEVSWTHIPVGIPIGTIKKGHQFSGDHYGVPQPFSLDMDLVTRPSRCIDVL